jgi:imidazole glycerol-phosphate synthase subunit HisH
VKSAVIVDNGGANLASLRFALARLECHAEVTADGATIASADRVILPGVGAAKPAMERLRSAGLTNVLRTLTQPVLGICLGMQLLFERSDEDQTLCLAVLPGSVQSLKASRGRPVPHMGWNELRCLKIDPLLYGVEDGEHFYFVHGYAVGVTEHTLASTEYGVAITAVVRRRNFWGAQFHPERSGAPGARVLDNFLRL